jgi:cytosine/adenosine deaminase-related metal-dependent hydrolase
MPGIICPGLINTHCHLELSHMKGLLPEHTGLIPFLSAVQQQRFFSPEIIAEAAQQAAAQMIGNGIVAVGDICNTADSLAAKAASHLHWHNFIEVIGFTENKAAERLAFSQTILNHFLSQPQPQSKPQSFSSLSPHAPYSVSGRLFGLLNEATAGQLVTIHNQECAAEDELYRHKSGQFFDLYAALGIVSDFFTASGKSSLQSWLPYFNKGQQLILVHNTCTSEEDILFVKQMTTDDGQRATAGNRDTAHDQRPTIFWCLCPNANLYIENKLPPVELLLKHDCRVVLGTDSLASNHQLSIVAEMQTLRKHFPQLGWELLLRWATLNGAEALGMAAELGSFDKGKRPGWTVIEPDL